MQVERRRKRAPIAQKPEAQPLEKNQALKNLTSEERAARTRALKEGLQQQENQTDKETEATQIEPELIAEDANNTEEISVSTPEEIVEESVEESVQTKNQQSVDEKEKALEEEQKILEAARLAEQEEARLAKATSNRQLGRSSEKSSAAQNVSDNEETIDDENETAKPTKKRIESGKKLAVAPGRRGEPRRRHSGMLTISQALEDSGVERVRSLASVRRARERKNGLAKQSEIQKQIRDVVVPDAITVQELANRMAERAAECLKAYGDGRYGNNKSSYRRRYS